MIPPSIILAQAAPEAHSFLQLWIAIAFLAGVGANIVTVISVKRTQKREVSFTFVPASKDEFDAFKSVVDREHMDLRHLISNRDAACVGCQRDMQKQIDAVRVELSDKMDEMPSRIITILKNTNAI